MRLPGGERREHLGPDVLDRDDVLDAIMPLIRTLMSSLSRSTSHEEPTK
ncbi:hypothetical protein [Mycobacterium sp. URHB0021]